MILFASLLPQLSTSNLVAAEPLCEMEFFLRVPACTILISMHCSLRSDHQVARSKSHCYHFEDATCWQSVRELDSYWSRCSSLRSVVSGGTRQRCSCCSWSESDDRYLVAREAYLYFCACCWDSSHEYCRAIPYRKLTNRNRHHHRSCSSNMIRWRARMMFEKARWIGILFRLIFPSFAERDCLA